MDKAKAEYIREEVERQFGFSLDCFGMDEIIDCSDRLDSKEKKWAKKNITWKIVIGEE